MFRDDSEGRPISTLTLAVRRPALGREPALTEMTDTFSGARIASFEEDLSAAPTGSVTLSLPSLGRVLTSPKAVAGSASYHGMPAPSSSAPNVDLELAAAFAKPSRLYRVSAVKLVQLAAASPRSRARFSLSLDTSSLVLLEGILHEGSSGRAIPVLTLAVHGSGSGSQSVTMRDTFYGATVTSFDETLSGSFSGQVTLSAAGPR